MHSGRVLLALTQKGVSREDAYRLVQRSAMRAWQGGGGLKDLLKADPEVTRWLEPAELEALFDLEYHFKEVDTVFARVFGELHRSMTLQCHTDDALLTQPWLLAPPEPFRYIPVGKSLGWG